MLQALLRRNLCPVTVFSYLESRRVAKILIQHFIFLPLKLVMEKWPTALQYVLFLQKFLSALAKQLIGAMKN